MTEPQNQVGKPGAATSEYLVARISLYISIAVTILGGVAEVAQAFVPIFPESAAPGTIIMIAGMASGALTSVGYGISRAITKAAEARSINITSGEPTVVPYDTRHGFASPWALVGILVLGLFLVSLAGCQTGRALGNWMGKLDDDLATYIENNRERITATLADGVVQAAHIGIELGLDRLRDKIEGD